MFKTKLTEKQAHTPRKCLQGQSMGLSTLINNAHCLKTSLANLLFPPLLY